MGMWRQGIGPTSATWSNTARPITILLAGRINLSFRGGNRPGDQGQEEGAWLNPEAKLQALLSFLGHTAGWVLESTARGFRPGANSCPDADGQYQAPVLLGPCTWARVEVWGAILCDHVRLKDRAAIFEGGCCGR